MGGVFLSSILAATVLTLFSACDSPSSSWEEPVRDYFDKYTNTAAIEKQEISFKTQKDNSGTTCIPSDGNKTVTFYLRNPRLYTLDINFPEATEASGLIVEQDMQDKTVIRLTYPQDYLLAHEGGQQIGGTIYLTESETLREFDPYSFSLKCNTPPPGVKGQSVQSNGSNYIVCFYVPTTELVSTRHQNDTHTLFINGSPIVTGSAAELAAASSPQPSTLAPVGNNARFNTTAPNGYVAFFFDTNRAVADGDNIRWDIRLEDDDGFKSRTVTASTIVAPVPLTISGNDVLTLNEGEKNTTLTATVDDGSIISSCEWRAYPEGIVTVPSGAQTSTTANVTASSGGVATVEISATLLDGRVVTQQKTVRVLSLEYNSSSPQDFLKGQNGIYPEVAALGFPTSSPAYTWEIGDSSVATINSATGAINALAKGSTTVTVSASYGGKTVSKTTDIYVHEVTVSGVTELFVGGNSETLTATVSSPSGRLAPSGITYSWTAGAGSAVDISGSGNRRTASPGSNAGTGTVTCTASLNGIEITVATKTISVYKIEIDVTPPTSRNTNTANGGTNPYALTNLSDPFTFAVKTASQFPTGTKFHWTVNGISLTSPTQQGSSVSIAPNAMGITNTTISKDKASPTSFDVRCQVELPSGTCSQTVQMSLNVYKLTIPPMKITVETTPALPTTSGGHIISILTT
ncbi:MAG: Ig-like domain-containing protein [Treponema sp.]|nr:Ig-like domain-containing protein [Treponema sp.]